MRIRLAACCALLAFAAQARADDGKVSLGFGGGVSIPSQPQGFSEFWNNGFNLGGHVGYRLSRHLAFVASVDYDRFGFDEAGASAQLASELGIDTRRAGISIAIEGADATALSGSVRLKASVTGDDAGVAPYVVGGVGVTRVSTSDVSLSVTAFGQRFEETEPGDSQTAAAVSFGAGLDFALGDDAHLFLEGQYHVVFTDDESTQYPALKLGLRFGL